ncbi:hypothetical protein [Streptomyces wuyuanensis]|uniref:hypothetical protein n=1 Tax=Streptomyces wuyuanensis TaxID=1196353 RepID=UPI00371AB4CB
MGRGITRAGSGADGTEAAPDGVSAHDVHRSGERIAALAAAVLLFTALFAVDAGLGSLDVTRGAVWTGLSGPVFVILRPSRVAVCPGRPSTRGTPTTDTVRTDCLVSVRCSDGVSRRMILRDTAARRAPFRVRARDEARPASRRHVFTVSTGLGG